MSIVHGRLLEGVEEAMNGIDRGKLQKLYDFLGTIPPINESKGTLSARPFINYYKELNILTSALQELTKMIAFCEHKKADELIEKIESWLKKRQTESWQEPKEWQGIV